ncbi:MAG: hypothetical protein A3K30_04925 [Deltaproteobacteria bacterium RBG_13_51_10]|jgi:signal transduction histidine kinase|nr:MAG: hypothetical protein A3K30_04925 [Deltaproteobacteria bacterium RBG_13_51_10]
MGSDPLTSKMNQTGRVLVVDDEESNRELLRVILEAQGHQVFVAVNGIEGLERVVEDRPDVVLLDVLMPKMNGNDVCRQLKGSPQTASIPVILISGLRTREDMLKGIEAGANDFLSKPVDTRDVLLRVRNAIYTKRLFDQLEESYHRLRELEALRDNLTHMIVHDLRNPLTGIQASLQLMQLRMRMDNKLDPNTVENLDLAFKLTKTLAAMISSLLDISKLEAGKMSLNLRPGDLRTVTQEALQALSSTEEHERVILEESSQAVEAPFDRDMIQRVIANLVGNAIKFTPREGKIGITVKREGDQAQVAVTDTGPGISPEYQEKIFEKFGQVEAAQVGQNRSTGLGLTFCKLAVEAHGGKIMVESRVGEGSTFRFWLPTKKEILGPEVKEK